jgi:hypothetical protein
MEPGTIVLGVILFAAASAVLYLWGMKRQISKTKDLMNLLFSNGVAKVNKYLKKNDFVTASEIEKMVTGMTARFPLSKDKSIVTKPKDFTKQLLDYMLRTGQLREENNKYYKVKRKK